MNNRSNTYLAEAPVRKLIVQFSVPCILSLLVSSLYNIVDQIFIGRGVGYLGNGATNVVFPITVIALALALMIGDGCAAYLSICQGMGDKERSHRSVGNAIMAFLLVSIVLTALFAFGRETILSIFGATENNIDYAREYFDIILIGIPFYIITNGMNSIIRADGSPQFAMFSTLIGCILNIILDPIAIFVLHWGVRGAALATIAGQIVSFCFSFYYLFHTKSFRLSRDSFRPNADILRHILPLGISSLLTQLSIVVIMGVMNSTLVKYGALSEYGADIPMTVMGIVMKVFQIVIAFVVGIAAGCQPIVGYNFGAGNIKRVKEIFRDMMIAEVVIGVVATLLFELFPVQIISLFGSESDLYKQFAVYAFRIFLSAMVLCCVQKSTSIFLQSLGKPVHSMALSLLREFVLSVPLVLLLPQFHDLGVLGPLYSGPIADVISCTVAVIMVLSVLGRLSSSGEEEQASSGQTLAGEFSTTAE
ncbi:MAG: MATE family efflux transporter [Eubacteriales bacterium]|nr:MATE family efflux transporter [Eubacteriales bacterium]